MFIPASYLCSVNKRDSIIKAALQLLVVNGIHATPMSAIAKAANTGMGTIYNYFTNKNALVNAIYVDIKKHEELLLSRPPTKRTIKTQFEQYYTTVINFYFEHPDYFKFMEQLEGSPIITEASKREGMEAINPVLEILKNGQDEGIIKKIGLEEILLFLGGTIFSHLRWVNSQQSKNLIIKNQMHLVWDAIKA